MGVTLSGLKQALLVVAVCTLSACSTIVEGTSQNVTINTDPPGATCELDRAGQVAGVVNPTPGTIEVEKSGTDLKVVCDKDGFQTAEGILSSSFEAMTLGNVILGGLVGVAIDAASGATNKYPETLQLTLTPNSFETIADRDAHFDARVAAARRSFEAKIETQENTCKSDPSELCRKKVEELRSAMEAAISEIEALRLIATVTAPDEKLSYAPWHGTRASFFARLGE